MLTSAALCDGLMALDVGMALPDATSASENCVDFMYQQKVNAYSMDEHAELMAQGIKYWPIIFTCYSQAHLETRVLLSHLAASATHCHGLHFGK